MEMARARDCNATLYAGWAGPNTNAWLSNIWGSFAKVIERRVIHMLTARTQQHRTGGANPLESNGEQMIMDGTFANRHCAGA